MNSKKSLPPSSPKAQFYEDSTDALGNPSNKRATKSSELIDATSFYINRLLGSTASSQALIDRVLSDSEIEPFKVDITSRVLGRVIDDFINSQFTKSAQTDFKNAVNFLKSSGALINPIDLRSFGEISYNVFENANDLNEKQIEQAKFFFDTLGSFYPQIFDARIKNSAYVFESTSRFSKKDRDALASKITPLSKQYPPYETTLLDEAYETGCVSLVNLVRQKSDQHGSAPEAYHQLPDFWWLRALTHGNLWIDSTPASAKAYVDSVIKPAVDKGFKIPDFVLTIDFEASRKNSPAKISKTKEGFWGHVLATNLFGDEVHLDRRDLKQLEKAIPIALLLINELPASALPRFSSSDVAKFSEIIEGFTFDNSSAYERANQSIFKNSIESLFKGLVRAQLWDGDRMEKMVCDDTAWIAKLHAQCSEIAIKECLKNLKSPGSDTSTDRKLKKGLRL